MARDSRAARASGGTAAMRDPAGMRGTTGVRLGCEDEARARRLRDDRLRAINVCVYRHMMATTGAIHYRLANEWAYQPTEAEIAEEMRTPRERERERAGREGAAQADQAG